MKTQLFIFIEGGGPSIIRGRVNKDNNDFRRFLTTLFKPLVKNPNIEVNIVAEGGNSETVRAFLKNRRKQDVNNVYLILLDSDEPHNVVSQFNSKVEFISQKFIWNNPDINLKHNRVSENELFFMVAEMEVWLLAGINELPKKLLVDQLAQLPSIPQQLESLSKDELNALVKQIIRGYSKRKGLQAIQHLNASVLRSKLTYFDELATALETL